MSEEQITEVREAHRFDEGRLADYLAKNIDGFSPDIAIQQFEGGQSNPTFLVSSNNKKYVIRKKPPGKLLASAHMVEREYRIMKALEKSPMPVPYAHLLCEDVDVIGTPFFVMDYMEGRLFSNLTLPDMTPEQRAEIYEESNRVLAVLHSIVPEDYGLEDFGKPGNYFERQVGRWSKQYIAAKTDEIESIENLMTWLADNTPSDQTTCIVHGDYLLNNMMFHPTEPKILGVFDWELSTLGHPLADLAYTCMPYHLNTSGQPLRFMTDAGIPTEEAFIEAYCKRTGRDSIDNWNYYMAFSFFRYASIVQGVYKRGLEGNASSGMAKNLGGFVKMIGDIGASFIK